TTVAPGIIMSKPIYFVILTAIPDRGDPFLLESDGYAGGETNMSVHVIRVQIRDQNEANQVADVFRRAAVLCGAPIQPVQTAADSSLATTAAAQRTPIPTASGVAAPPADAPKIDPSKVKFLMRACSKGIMGDDNAMFRRVIGTLALDIDLSQEATVRQLLTMAATFAQDKCPSPYPCGSICVYLRPGNPATFTDYKQGFEYVPESYLGIVYDSPPDSVSASTGDSRFEPERSQLTWVAYQNRPREIKDQQAQEAAQARQRDAAMEQQRQAEQKKQSEIAARSAAFVKANGVEHFVTVQQLAANPFVYQGQVVAIYGEFQQMNSATEGLFSVQDKSFVVSAIPAAKFTLPTSMVMLAGRVLGNIEIKLPVLGPTLVPHLSFVGSAFCQERGGSDYDINLKRGRPNKPVPLKIQFPIS